LERGNSEQPKIEDFCFGYQYPKTGYWYPGNKRKGEGGIAVSVPVSFFSGQGEFTAMQLFSIFLSIHRSIVMNDAVTCFDARFLIPSFYKHRGIVDGDGVRNERAGRVIDDGAPVGDSGELVVVH